MNEIRGISRVQSTERQGNGIDFSVRVSESGTRLRFKKAIDISTSPFSHDQYTSL